MKIINKEAFKVAVLFFLVAFVWIVILEILFFLFLKNEKYIYILHITNACLFAIVTTVIIYLLVRKEIEKKDSYKDCLEIEHIKYKTLFETANDAIFIVNNQNTFIDCNEKTLKVFHCTREQIIGKSPFEVSPEMQAEGVSSLVYGTEKMRSARKGTSQCFEWIHTTLNDKKDFLAEVSLNSLKIGNDNFILSIVRDISEKRAIEQELRKSEESFRKLFENAMVGMVVSELDELKIVACNKEFAKIFGYETIDESLVEINNKSLSEYRDFNAGFKDQLIKDGKIENVELEVLRDDDESIWIEFSSYFNKRTNLLESVIKDISLQKRAEKALRESEARYKMIIDNVPSIFWIMDKDGKYNYLSDNIFDIYGYTKEDVNSDTDNFWFERIHKDDLNEVKREIELAFTENKKLDIDYRIKRKDGKWLWIHRIGEKITDEKGQELLYGLSTDITEKRNAFQKVYYAMMNAEERERSRVAKELHDGVSPILSAIKLYIQSLINSKDDLQRNEISKKIYNTINEAIQSIFEISNRLSPHILQNFGLSAAIQSFIDKISETTGLQFSFFLDNGNKLDENKLDENIEVNLYRIVVELINNAVKYGDAENINISINEKKQFVEMHFEHNGKGFNLENVLKESKGMGLRNLINRVKSLNGKFEMDTDINSGVKVDLIIPLNNY